MERTRTYVYSRLPTFKFAAIYIPPIDPTSEELEPNSA